MNIRTQARWVAASLVALGLGQGAEAAPTVAEVLAVKPHQAGVQVATPTAAEVAGCKIEAVPGANRAATVVVRDGQGQILRKFADSNGDGRLDSWSFYLDGQEAYREQDSNFNSKPDQFRWLGDNGSRWGIDVNEDGKIDNWRHISAEEVSQEILAALTTRDFARLQAIMLNEAEIKALDLTEGEAARVRESIAKAGAKFQQTVAALSGLTDKATWVHLETTAPQCLAAEGAGTKLDLIRYKHGTILYELGGKHDWIQTGELFLVNMSGVRAWRLIDAPTPGARTTNADTKGGIAIDEALKPLLTELQAVDATAPKSGGGVGPDAEVVRYNLARAAVLEKLVNASKLADREQWYKQVADCLSAAAQNSAPTDKAAYTRLVGLRDSVVKAAPGSGLAAYVVFREMSADYATKLATEKDLAKVQEVWVGQLKKFVETYPTGEDTPDALLQLGMVNEFMGKETDAKQWYETLTKNFAKHPLAGKAAGAKLRLSLEGKPLDLAGPTIAGTQYDISSLKGKVVIVYYWASWNQQCIGDFAKLKALLGTYASKGVELVCVNLDNNVADATGFVSKHGVPGTHLFQPGGLESPLAVQHGVMVLPNLFLVGKDGKVVSRTVQMGGIEDEVKKLAN